MVGADFNRHLGEGNRGDEEDNGFTERNLKGRWWTLLMAVVNTYFKKRVQDRVTYCTRVEIL